MNDEMTLIEQAQTGNQAAFGGLVQAYQRAVYNLAYRMLGNPCEAEEAAQEAFVRAYKHLHTYDHTRKFSSWLLAITSHYCVDRLRRRHAIALTLDEAPAASLAAAPAEAPEPTFLHAERSQEIQALLSTLPESYRAALVLRYWQDLSYEEIAQVLGTSEKAVKSRLHRARELMATRLAEPKPAHPLAGSGARPAHAMPARAAWA